MSRVELSRCVRRAIGISALKYFLPLDARVEAARCAAWFALRAATPGIPGGRLEAIIDDHAQYRVLRALDAFRCAPAANDTAHADAAVFPADDTLDQKAVADREGAWSHIDALGADWTPPRLPAHVWHPERATLPAPRGGR
jgi:hypothetical protein